MSDIKIIIEPEGKTVKTGANQKMQDILANAGIVFTHPCGGRASCGHCRIQFLEGAPEPTAPEKKLLPATALEEGIRLSCCSRPTADSRVRLLGAVPKEAAFDLGQREAIAVEVLHDVAKLSLKIDTPTLEDQTDLLERVQQQLQINGAEFKCRFPDIPIAHIQRLPGVIQEGIGLLSVTFDSMGWIALQSGDRHDELFGLAIDVGTTTLAIRLVNLITGEQGEQDIRLNGQVAWGADVVCRIDHCRQYPQGATQLRDRVQQDLSEMTEALLEKQGIPRESVARVAVAGNPTMMHLVLGVNPASIAETPYAPVWTEMIQVPSSELGMNLAAGARALLAPCLSGYIGGDVLCGALMSGMDQSEETSLLIDVGTNGEIVLCHKGKMAAAATAAGPAFEGAQISCGAWAARGAIDRVSAENGSLQVHTLGDQPPIGLCGTGLVDTTALLVQQGVVNFAGKMLSPEQVDHIPEYLKNRVKLMDNQPAFELGHTPDGRAIQLLARDVRQVQLAKGAIQAGVEILCRESGIAFSEIDRVYLAGSFGKKIVVENLQRLGLLHGIAPDKVLPIGNSSLAGAQMLLLSEQLRERIERLRQNIRYIELSSYAAFTEVFADSMLFPES